MANYRHVEGSVQDESQLRRKVALAPEEELLGVYDNPKDSAVSRIVVTTLGLYLLTGGGGDVERIPYVDIKLVQGPDVSPARNPKIVLELVSGGMRSVPILGHRGQYQDVFEFWRFLTRAIADIRGRPVA